MEQCTSIKETYVNKLGSTTFIIKSSFIGEKTLADAFEEIIINSFRSKYSNENNSTKK